MLIDVININIADMLSKPQENIRKIQAINNLLNLSYNRKHIVIINRSVLDSIIDDNTGVFGLIERTHAQDLKYNLTRIGGFKYLFDIRIDVDFSDVTNEFCNDLYGKEIIIINYARFVDHEFLQTPLLLCENINDAKLYLFLSTLYLMKDDNFNCIKINVIPDHGGGSTTINKFTEVKDLHKICLCILDSDKKFPEDSEKNTSLSFSSQDRKINNLSKAIVLDAHEIECIIPIYLLVDVLKEKKYGDSAILAIDRIKKINEYRRYLDHKKGMSLREALNLKVENKTNYWYEAFSKIEEVQQRDCFKMKTCLDCDNCIYITGLGDNVLSNTINYLDGINGLKYKKQVKQACLNDWAPFARSIIQWGSSLSHRSTVT